jgi:hypothetical protein
MFQVNEIKKWANEHGITIKKSGDGYVWFEKENPTNSNVCSIGVVAKEIFNKITNNKFVEHQKNYKAPEALQS